MGRLSSGLLALSVSVDHPCISASREWCWHSECGSRVTISRTSPADGSIATVTCLSNYLEIVRGGGVTGPVVELIATVTGGATVTFSVTK